MCSKILPTFAFPSFKKILTASRELNQIAKISTTETGLLIECMDTFNHTQLSCSIKAIEKSTIYHFTQTFIDLEKIVPLCRMLDKRQNAILIIFQSNSNLEIKDPNLPQIDLINPICFMEDYFKNYIPNHYQQSCHLISLVVADIAHILTTLCIADGVAQITLYSDGLLTFSNSCKEGQLFFKKILKGYKQQNNSSSSISILSDLFVTIKFVKVFINAAASSVNASCKKCTLELPDISTKENGILKLHFQICSDAFGYFALRSK